MVWKFKLFPVENNVDIIAGKYVACLIYQPYSSSIEIKKRQATLSFPYNIFKVSLPNSNIEDFFFYGFI